MLWSGFLMTTSTPARSQISIHSLQATIDMANRLASGAYQLDSNGDIICCQEYLYFQARIQFIQRKAND